MLGEARQKEIIEKLNRAQKAQFWASKHGIREDQAPEPHDRKLAVFAFCVLCLRSAFCVMLGARTMLGATENMEFINIY